MGVGGVLGGDRDHGGDGVRADEARQRADALLSELGAAVGDEGQTGGAVEVVDRVAVEVDDVGVRRERGGGAHRESARVGSGIAASVLRGEWVDPAGLMTSTPVTFSTYPIR